MNRESFYLEIGNIDDDLICEAKTARGHKNRRKYMQYFAGIAACLCLMCGGLIYSLQRDVIHYNIATESATAKVFIPEGTTVCDLTYPELCDYYGLEPLPDTLSGLSRSERSVFYIYKNAGEIILDENRLDYASADGGRTVTVTLATKEYDMPFDKTTENSRIDGVSMVLSASETAVGTSGQRMYWAEIEQQNLYVCVVSLGLDEEAFIQVIRELLESQK